MGEEMGHEQIQEMILDYCMGGLPPGEQAVVASHLTSCRECRHQVLLISYLEESGKAGITEAIDPHPNAREITDFALEEGEMSSQAKEMIADHIKSCSQCGDFVAFARQAHDLPEDDETIRPFFEEQSRGFFSRSHVVMWSGYAAAAILAFFLVFPLTRQVSVPRTAPVPFIAGSSAIALQDATLSGEIPTITLHSPEPYFQITIASQHFARQTRPDDRVRIRVRSQNSKATILDRSNRFADLTNKDIATIVTLIIPRQGLAAGQYRVSLENLDRPETTFESLFELVKTP